MSEEQVSNFKRNVHKLEPSVQINYSEKTGMISIFSPNSILPVNRLKSKLSKDKSGRFEFIKTGKWLFIKDKSFFG